MTKDELVKLAERCEAASGPDRGLDELIAFATGWVFRVDQHDDDLRDDVWTDPEGNDRAWHLFFTASIDAAMALVPEGWSISFGEKPGLPPERRMFAWLNDHNTPGGIAVRHTEASARTIALSICAAALRARATTTGEGK